MEEEIKVKPKREKKKKEPKQPKPPKEPKVKKEEPPIKKPKPYIIKILYYKDFPESDRHIFTIDFDDEI